MIAGVEGVFIYKFNYEGLYNPKLASQIDPTGKHISISLTHKQPLEKMLPWVKGMNVDVKNGVIITWSMGVMGNQAFVAFNRLFNRKYSNGDNK